MTTWSKNCVWSVNTGFSKDRTEWSIENAIENGDIPAEKKPSYEQVVDIKLGEEALKAVGGPTKIKAVRIEKTVTGSCFVIVKVEGTSKSRTRIERSGGETKWPATHSLRSKIARRLARLQQHGGFAVLSRRRV